MVRPTEADAAKTALPLRVDIPSGIPGLNLTHHITRAFIADGIPIDGAWCITHTASDRQVNGYTGFRTLHAAAHMAQRVNSLTDWTLPADELPVSDPEISAAVRHSEAHAHEVDAVYPPSNVIEMGNGPSIVDDTGDLRRFIAQAPTVDWEKSDTGELVCADCGELPPFPTEAS